MKKNLLCTLLVCAGLISSAQNPFATSVFYSAFKKVYADGQKGFPATKGAWINETGIFYDNYKVNTLLPLADSGRLSQPLTFGIGYPFVTFYYNAGKTLAQAKVKEARLHDALRTAWSTPLTETSRIDTLKQFIFYRKYFYTNPEAIKRSAFEFNTSLVQENGLYILGLTINGKNETAATPSAAKTTLYEADLDKKIKEVMTAMDNLFTNEKGTEISQNQYYTEYESRTAVYGQKCKLKDRKFEISLNFTAGPELLSGPEEAKAIYDKLLAVFTGTGRFVFKPEMKEGSRTYVFASENVTKKFSTSRYSLVLEYYNTPGMASVSFLINRKKF